MKSESELTLWGEWFWWTTM